MDRPTIYSSRPISLLEPQNFNIHIITLPEDIHLEEAVLDICSLFSREELSKETWLPAYIRETISRWGRWTLRGRAPSSCFQAACAAGQRFLQKKKLEENEYTSKVDSALAVTLAGMIVDAVEPSAVDGPIRDKAIQIVADEFLAKAASPQVSLPAQRRMKARKTVFAPETDTNRRNSVATIDAESNNDSPSSSDDEKFSPFAPSRKSQINYGPTRTYRSPSLPNTSLANSLEIEGVDKMMLGSSSARSRSGSASAKLDFSTIKQRPSVSGTKFSDILNSVLSEVETYLDNLSEKKDDASDKRS